MATWLGAIGKAQQAGLRILLDHPEGMRPRDLWPAVREALPGIEEETASVANGKTTAGQHFRLNSIDLGKAGWLTRRDGRWFATPVGRWALGQYSDPAKFFSTANRSFTYWKSNRAQFDVAKRIVETLPDGGWVSIDELAERCKLKPAALVRWLQGERPDGWYRVLDADGGLPDAVFADPATRDHWYELLDEDGIQVAMDVAAPQHRVPGPELNQLVEKEAELDAATEPGAATEPRARRAWLVRGTSARGYNLVQHWLDVKYCSLPASRLRALPQGASRAEIAQAVDEDYDTASHSERARRVTEFYAFLTQMRAGDLVVTIDGTDTFLGEITGDATFVASQENRANLQRPVTWQRRDPPYDFGEDLPDALAAKISSQHDVLDLTDFLAELENLHAGGEPEFTTVRLPDPTPELADRLHVGVDWLRDRVELLGLQRQLIFYGPPGTGKTFLAQEIAAFLTGGQQQNVKLVQFHPAYSYEDFFQGFRPKASKEGIGVTFVLHNGPLSRMAAAATEHKDQPYVLIIDEINRGNLAKIFGELYFLLEYRDKAVDLMYGSDDDLADQAFVLPPNLFIIGTMNTADRSIALVDAAMRRRFAFVELHPGEEPTARLLREWLGAHGLPDEAARLLDALNRNIADREFQIGPSYLMKDWIYTRPRGLDLVWRTQILPLLEEHHYGDGVDIEARYGLDVLRRAIE